MLFTAFQSYVTLTFTGRMINALLDSDPFAFVGPLVALTGLQLLGGSLSAFSSYRSFRMQTSYANECERELFEEIGALPLAEPEHPRYGERLALRRFAVSKPYELYAQLSQLLSRLLTALLGFRFLSAVHPGIGAFAFAIGCLKGGLHLMLVKRRAELNEELQRASVRPSYLYDLLTGAASQKELTVYGSRPYFIARWLSAKRLSDGFLARLQRMQLTAGFGGEAISAAGYAIAACAAAWAIRERGLGPGDFMAATMALSLIANNVSALIQSWANVAETQTYLDQRQVNASDGEACGDKPFVFAKEITLPALRYTYPNRDKPALDIGRMRIGYGEKIAILGGNGSGKSTLLKVILGLYAPEGEPVRYDGVPVSALDRASLYARVHVLFQDFVRYQGTVRENMAAGRENAGTDDERLRDALRLSGIGELAEGRGPDTPLGQLDGTSVYLSGGQWQKLALSRLHLQGDVDLIALDEPTSALDPLSEASVMDAIAESYRDKTILFVTHRAGLAQRADRIWVMHEGKIVEEGDHDALLSFGGRYARMWAIQQRDTNRNEEWS